MTEFYARVIAVDLVQVAALHLAHHQTLGWCHKVALAGYESLDFPENGKRVR